MSITAPTGSQADESQTMVTPSVTPPTQTQGEEQPPSEEESASSEEDDSASAPENLNSQNAQESFWGPTKVTYHDETVLKRESFSEQIDFVIPKPLTHKESRLSSSPNFPRLAYKPSIYSLRPRGYILQYR